MPDMGYAEPQEFAPYKDALKKGPGWKQTNKNLWALMQKYNLDSRVAIDDFLGEKTPTRNIKDTQKLKQKSYGNKFTENEIASDAKALKQLLDDSNADFTPEDKKQLFDYSQAKTQEWLDNKDRWEQEKQKQQTQGTQGNPQAQIIPPSQSNTPQGQIGKTTIDDDVSVESAMDEPEAIIEPKVNVNKKKLLSPPTEPMELSQDEVNSVIPPPNAKIRKNAPEVSDSMSMGDMGGGINMGSIIAPPSKKKTIKR